MGERSWKPRAQGEATTEYLGRVLDALGDPDLAERARQGDFDEYSARRGVADGLELTRLVAGLTGVERRAVRAGHLLVAERVREVRAAVRAGEFNATEDEAARWRSSPEGRLAIAELSGDRDAIEAAERALREAAAQDG